MRRALGALAATLATLAPMLRAASTLPASSMVGRVPRTPLRRAALSARGSRVAMSLVPEPATGETRVRFAPSPTGSLHVGGARTALFNWLLARQKNGKFIIRVEDTDTARSTRESEQSMLRDLAWLGLAGDEGPDMGGERGPYRQSERGELYKELAAKLMAEGKAYPCFCTEEELEAKRLKAEAEGKDTKYDGTWRDADPATVQAKLDAGEPYTVRFKVPKNKYFEIDDVVRDEVGWDAEATVGDFILLRSNGIPVYNFCVAVDDALMGVTTVIRAEEHLTNTLRQGLILEALGYPIPQYAHLSLVLGEDRSKLSKRHGATSLDQFRTEGFLPEAMMNYLSLLGWNDGTEKEIFSPQELIESFSLERITKSPAIFDMTKLRWVNAQHLRQLPTPELTAMLRSRLVEAGVCAAADGANADAFFGKVTDLAAERIETVNDVDDLVRAVLTYKLADTIASGDASKVVDGGFAEVAAEVVASFERGEMPKGDEADFAGAWKAWTKQLGAATGRKGKQLFMPLRLALTGALSGVDVGATVQLLSLADGIAAEVTPMDARMRELKEMKLPAGAAA